MVKKYRRIKENLDIVEHQFEKFRLAFQTDFEAKEKVSTQEPGKADPPFQNLGPESAGIEWTVKADIPEESGQAKIQEEAEMAKAVKASTMKGKMTKLYRKLCKKFHPDVSESESVSRFMDVQRSYENGDGLGMIEIAVQSGMDVDEYIDNKEEMILYWEREIERMELTIYTLTHTLPWVWGMADNQRKQEIRPNIIRNLEEHGWNTS
jgi:hypothetical protein